MIKRRSANLLAIASIARSYRDDKRQRLVIILDRWTGTMSAAPFSIPISGRGNGRYLWEYADRIGTDAETIRGWANSNLEQGGTTQCCRP